jgi:hypothetical protein
MLERRGLIDLERSLRDTLVLSVYLDAPSPNPAERDVWRTRLDQELERVRKQITERPERRAFDRATGLLRDELESRSDAIGAAGWLGVVAPDDIRFRTPLAVSPPLSVHWGRGMFVTPALRALEPKYPLWREFAYEYEHDRLAIDLLSGSDLLRIWVDDRRSRPKDLDALVLADEKAWHRERRAYLLY